MNNVKQLGICDTATYMMNVMESSPLTQRFLEALTPSLASMTIYVLRIQFCDTCPALPHAFQTSVASPQISNKHPVFSLKSLLHLLYLPPEQRKPSSLTRLLKK